jgi:hypothetical protein
MRWKTLPNPIMLEILHGEDSIAEFCRKEGIVQNIAAAFKRLRDWTPRPHKSNICSDTRKSVIGKHLAFGEVH